MRNILKNNPFFIRQFMLNFQKIFLLEWENELYTKIEFMKIKKYICIYCDNTKHDHFSFSIYNRL